MSHIKLNGLQFYYEREGKGHPLILIGGYTCDVSLWDFARKILSKHFDLILLDNRGSGRTEVPKKEFTVEQMADDVIQLIQALDLIKPHIVGHSMGGMIAQQIAMKAPSAVGKIALAQTSCKINPIAAAALGSALHLRQHKVSPHLQSEVTMPWLFSKGTMQNATFCAEIIQNLEKYPHSISLEGQEKQYKALIQFDSHPWCHLIKSICLVCAGEEDLLIHHTESRALAEKLNGAKWKHFPKMGHLAPVEIPEDFCRILSEFFSS